MSYLPVNLTALHKLLVSSYTGYFTLIEHYYLICVKDSAYTLCNDDYRAVVNVVGKCLSELDIGLEVKRREAVVKQIYLRLFCYCAGN